MLLRDMLSKAPIPSTERMVWFGLVWERVVSVWTMASVPARVDSAYWCGWHAAWKVVAYCCAMQRETKRRSVSPTTMPRTLPLGFCKATRRPKAIAVAMVGGTRAWARSCVTWPSWAVLVSSSKSNRSVSVVRPEGPGAAPLRARRRLRRIMVMGMSAGRSGSNAMTSGASGPYSSWGRRTGSRSSSKVCWVPGAKGPAVSACRAADSSPRWTRYRARSARLV